MTHPSDDFGYDPPEPPHDWRVDEYEPDRNPFIPVYWALAFLAVILILGGVWLYLAFPSRQNKSEIQPVPRFVPAVIHKTDK